MRHGAYDLRAPRGAHATVDDAPHDELPGRPGDADLTLGQVLNGKPGSVKDFCHLDVTCQQPRWEREPPRTERAPTWDRTNVPLV